MKPLRNRSYRLYSLECAGQAALWPVATFRGTIRLTYNFLLPGARKAKAPPGRRIPGS